MRTGHLEEVGGRVKRTQVSINAFRLFQVLPIDGSGLSNARAQKIAQLSDRTYEAAKQLLLRTGEITRGQGQGGTIRRATDLKTTSRSDGYRLEKDMYGPFVTWLSDEQRQPGETFRKEMVTGSGASQRRRTGQWSKPDIISIIVTDFEMLPTVEVTINTFELKLARSAQDLAGVYEASAHQRRSHYSSLVLEWPLDDDDLDGLAAVEDECIRLGVGLLRMWGGEAEWLLQPVRKSPEPAELNQFIEDLLPNDDRSDYLSSIGTK